MGVLSGKIKKKKCCRDCQFLSKIAYINGQQRQVTWTKDERKRSREKYQLITGHLDQAHCYKGMWPSEDDPDFVDELEDHVEQLDSQDLDIDEIDELSDPEFLLKKRISVDNGHKCFFIKYQKGVSFETAFELWKIRNENRQLKWAHWATVAGLGIAAIGAVVAGLDNFVEYGGKLINWIVSLWN